MLYLLPSGEQICILTHTVVPILLYFSQHLCPFFFQHVVVWCTALADRCCSPKLLVCPGDLVYGTASRNLARLGISPKGARELFYVIRVRGPSYLVQGIASFHSNLSIHLQGPVKRSGCVGWWFSGSICCEECSQNSRFAFKLCPNSKRVPDYCATLHYIRRFLSTLNPLNMGLCHLKQTPYLAAVVSD